MGSNRKLPFGYKMKNGHIVLNSAEYREVQYIFEQYQNGASFKELTSAMVQKGIPYDGNKPWNKNMVARILEDSRYTGEREYPQIISQGQFDAVALRRSKKCNAMHKTDAQKVLRQRCKEPISPMVEKEVLRHLNSLCERFENIESIDTQRQKNTTEARLKEKLGELLQRLPVDQTAAEKLIIQLAIVRYESIGNDEYETQRLRRIFQQREPSEDLDARLIKDAVSEVVIAADGFISIRLKNNQIIGKR